MLSAMVEAQNREITEHFIVVKQVLVETSALTPGSTTDLICMIFTP